MINKVEPIGKIKQIICPECDGTGKSEKGEDCSYCQGKGVLTATVVKQ